MADRVLRLRDVKAQQNQLKKIGERIQQEIKDALGAAGVGTVGGVPVVSWKEAERISVSVKVLEARYPEIAEECRDIKPVRTFLLLD